MDAQLDDYLEIVKVRVWRDRLGAAQHSYTPYISKILNFIQFCKLM